MGFSGGLGPELSDQLRVDRAKKIVFQPPSPSLHFSSLLKKNNLIWFQSLAENWHWQTDVAQPTSLPYRRWVVSTPILHLQPAAHKSERYSLRS